MQRTKKRLLRTVILCLLLLLLAAVWLMRKQPQQDAVILPDAAAAEAWLTLHGWQLGEPAVRDTQIPDAWSTAAGQRWLTVQHQQGISPEQYAGQCAKQYLYPVENWVSPHCKAELLIAGDALAGAQIYDEETQLIYPVR